MRKNTYLFVHHHMPSQFLHLCTHLRDAGHRVVFVTGTNTSQLGGIMRAVYPPVRGPGPDTHRYLLTMESAVLHGQAVYLAIRELLRAGIEPDIVVGHTGWGEMLFARDALPHVPIVNYWEFFYNAVGQDCGFDPEYPSDLDNRLSLRVRNSVALISWAASGHGITPTRWQWSTHPEGMRAGLSVVHEGIDTDASRPDAAAVFTLPDGRTLRPGMKVLTFAARYLEPYRGFHVFMRALPEIRRRHPDADILIVGHDGGGYGPPPPDGGSYKARLVAETGLDLDRVWFTGLLPMDRLLAVFQVSAVHVYFTYPFILSWSVLQAMACGCLVLGSRTPPVEEVLVDRGNGLLVDFFDRAALVDRVDEALSAYDAFAGLRAAARDTIRGGYDLRSICLPRQSRLLDALMERR